MKGKTLGLLAGSTLAIAAVSLIAVVGSSPAPGTPASPAPETSNSRPAAPASSPVLRDVDGGPDYYGKFTNSLPTDPSFFPIGVWLESVLDRGNTAMDAAAGLNTYVELTGNSDVQLIKDAGMYALPTFRHDAAAGFVLSDEVDMWAGPGDARWTGKYPGEGAPCFPAGTPCGYTIQKERRATAPQGALLYSNYGKGVTFWESDEEAHGFIRGVQDVVSADNYWFTDPNICGKGEGGAIIGYTRDLTREECRLAANYGWTIDRLRKLQDPGAGIPVWAFVENGHPSGDVPNTTTITGPELRAAVWSSLIHGARGIIYFNHNFGGECVTQHVIRDCGRNIVPTLTAVNHQITTLAPVLNAPFLDGATTAAGPVDVTTKLHDGKVYVFAGANKNTGGPASFRLQCGGSTAVVIDENRTIPVIEGTFTDTFADGNAVHLYRIEGGGSCGF
ncbi:hypothetical protein [Arthrobacter sp. StoSoilB20]|uniref:hypothetical protein n=1 Tax=Arthrobacter sp. StoSoilB20 TaxID=2830995 RepID=UPI001CC46961|nr:hypothetical protein [Arthrobacter sp. StoSoilB20]BCW58936.1 hypothetical protein StoSoilB20_22830 [Arthrobacter sp. StoSoilB20]